MIAIDSCLMADGWAYTRDTLLAEARTWLIGQGNDEWDVDNALATARTDRAHWSDIYNGFVHDCALHLPEETDPAQCYPDSRQVSIVCDLPPSLVGI